MVLFDMNSFFVNLLTIFSITSTTLLYLTIITAGMTPKKRERVVIYGGATLSFLMTVVAYQLAALQIWGY